MARKLSRCNQRPPGSMQAGHRCACGLRPTELDVSTRLKWVVEAASQRLTADLDVTPRRGPTTALTLALPPDWELEEVGGAAGNASRSVAPGPAGRRFLTLELARPLESGVTHTIQLQGRARLPAGEVPFPDVVVSGARIGQTYLDVRIGPQWDATYRPGPAALAL